MEEYPEQAASILEAGMELGNGGPGLEEMEGFSVKEFQRGIRETEEAAEGLGAGNLRLFRPPLGGFDENLLKTAAAMGYTTVLWSADSMDWKNYGAEAIFQAAGAADSRKGSHPPVPGGEQIHAPGAGTGPGLA